MTENNLMELPDFNRELELELVEEQLKKFKQYCHEVENFIINQLDDGKEHLKIIAKLVTKQFDDVLIARSETEGKLSHEMSNSIQQYHDLYERKKDLVFRIKQHNENVESLKKKLIQTKEDLRKEKESNKKMRGALKKSQQSYFDLTGIDIKISESNNDFFIADVIFDESKAIVVKFQISRTDNRILGVDLGSFLTPTQQTEFMARFEKFDNVKGLISALKDKIVKSN